MTKIYKESFAYIDLRLLVTVLKLEIVNDEFKNFKLYMTKLEQTIENLKFESGFSELMEMQDSQKMKKLYQYSLRLKRNLERNYYFLLL